MGRDNERWGRRAALRRAVAIAVPSVLVLLSSASAPADDHLEFNRFPMPGGAAVAEVNGIVEDRDGAIWVVTWGDGIHRIHGTEWRTFTEAEGLPDDWVRSVSTAANGGVWAGTGEGVARIYEGAVYAATPVELPLLAGHDIFFVHELNTGEVWASTRDGSILARDASLSGSLDVAAGWRVIASSGQTAGDRVYQVVETDTDGILVSLSGGGLAWYREGEWVASELADAGQWFTLFSGVIHGENVLWASPPLSDGIYRYDGRQWSAREPGPVGIEDFAAGEADALYAATARGLFHWKNGEWSPNTFPEALGVPPLRQVLASRDGALWLGGKEGLVRGAKRSWTAEAKAGGPTALVPRSGPGEPVFAINPAGQVFDYADGEWHSRMTLSPWPDGEWIPDDSTWLGDGQVWIAPGANRQWLMVVRGELWRIQGPHLYVHALDDGRLLRQERLPAVEGYSARYAAPSDGRLWTLLEAALLQRDEDHWTPYPDYPGYENRPVYVARETSPGVFWAGVLGGLERWTPNGVTVFGEAEGVNEENYIYSICPARSGDIWFGSMGSGVYRYDGQTFHQMTKADGLYSNTVRAIFEASDGTIWIAYRGSGVSSFRGDRWVHFTYKSGLPNGAILGFAEPAPGELWAFDSKESLYRYWPDTLPPDTDIQIGPRNVDAHGVGVFSFEGRDAWNETQPQDLHYSWRVVPSGARAVPWSSFKTATTVATDSLRRGSYQFQVRSSDQNGNSDPTPASLEFVVAPPLWLKPVFYVPVLLSLVLASVAMGFRHRSHQALLRSEAALRREVAVRKQTEALLAQHRDNLESEVAERTGELERAHQTLVRKERLAALGQLTATVSHELRNPLGTIHGSLYLIDKRIRGKGLNLEGALDRMNRSVRRCDQIVDEMLDYTRTHEIHPQPVALDDWLRDALTEIGVPAHVSLKFALNCPAMVNLDPELMRRVLINLLDNAVQAMESVAGAQRHQIRASTRQKNGRVEIRLEDSGPGIPEEVREHIFEPLFSTKNFGVGLGTNIVKNIMERHEGGIAYANAPGGGAAAVLWMPARPADQA